MADSPSSPLLLPDIEASFREVRARSEPELPLRHPSVGKWDYLNQPGGRYVGVRLLIDHI